MFDVVQRLDSASVPDKREQRKAIMALEEWLLQQEQADIPPMHLAFGGMYARAVTVPAGTLLTGNIYRYDHIEIMAHGKILVTTDSGSSRVLEGFNMMPAVSGKKRAAFALEDTTWLTVHSATGTEQWEPEDIQKELTAETFEDLSDFYDEVSRYDYGLFLEATGKTDAQQKKSMGADVDIDLEELGLFVGDSTINGQGLKSIARIDAHSIVAPIIQGGDITSALQHVNHARLPNCAIVEKDGDFVLLSSQTIYAEEEITIDYNVVDAIILGVQKCLE